MPNALRVHRRGIRRTHIQSDGFARQLGSQRLVFGKAGNEKRQRTPGTFHVHNTSPAVNIISVNKQQQNLPYVKDGSRIVTQSNACITYLARKVRYLLVIYALHATDSLWLPVGDFLCACECVMCVCVCVCDITSLASST